MQKRSAPWHTDQWFTSPWNYEKEVSNSFTMPDTITIHDTTLRDGEQQAGVVFTAAEKLRIAEALMDAGVHRIEAGMPAVSAEDEKAIRAITELESGSEIYVLSRCMVQDVKRAIDCGVDGVIMEIPSSRHIIEKAYGWTIERARDLCIEATNYAHDQGVKVSFFPVDATRAVRDEYLELIGAVARDGHMDALGLVDTFGVLHPQAVPYFVQQSLTFGVPLETHFHMDYGLGVANSLIGVAAGASCIHATISGLGERAGNAPLEETVLALRTMYDKDVGIDTSRFTALARLVNESAGVCQPSNRPITGERLFDIESGLVASWFRNVQDIDLTLVVPFDPAIVGQPPPHLVLGKGSGLDSVLDALEELGLEADSDEVQKILLRLKEAGIEKHNTLTKAEFKSLAVGVLADSRSAASD